MTNSYDTYTIPLGEYLGDMTDELTEYGENACLTSYVSTGAKSYGFCIQKEDGSLVYSIKSKGFTLNWDAGKIIFFNEKQFELLARSINFDKMKEMVFEFQARGEAERIEIKGTGIRRTKDHQVVTKNESKTFGVTITKRVLIDEGFVTQPYGY